jgi:hypothetical protein
MSSTRKLIQAFLVILFVFAAARLFLIYRGRHGDTNTQEKQEREQQAAKGLDPDYYVTPKKLYAYDLKSAQQLAKQPVWVREGYRSTYYPVADGHTDFRHPAGTLGPLEKLQITQVVKDRAPGPRDPPQLVALFEKDGKKYGVPVGQMQGSDSLIYADEIFFLEDPHQLYKHWPADIWQAVDAHQVKPGMNEIQATFALGMGIPAKSDNPEVKTVTFPNGGNQVVITFQGGKAADIQRQKKT